jgi:hypothetical protein
MIYWEVVVKAGATDEEAYNFCNKNFGPDIRNNKMVWEYKGKGLFYIYREEDAAFFMLKYG